MRAIHSSVILLSIAALLTGCSPQKGSVTATPSPASGSARILEVSPPTPEPSAPKPTLTGERFTVGRLNLNTGDRIEQEYAFNLTIAGELSGTDSRNRFVHGNAAFGGSESVSWETEILSISDGKATELRDNITRARRQTRIQGSTNRGKDISESEAERSPLEGKTVLHRKGLRAWQSSVEAMPESEATGFEAQMSDRTLDPLLNGLFPTEPIPVGHTWTLTAHQAYEMVDMFPFDANPSASIWETNSEATAEFKEVSDYEGERCAVIQIRFAQKANEAVDQLDIQLRGQATLYVSIDSGLILKQVVEGPVQLHGDRQVEGTLSGKLQYERYMRKRTTSPSERSSG